MEVLKWIGYSVVAIVVLTVVLGGGVFIATVVALGGLIIGAVLLVLFTAVLVKEAIDEYLRKKPK